VINPQFWVILLNQRLEVLVEFKELEPGFETAQDLAALTVYVAGYVCMLGSGNIF
jgi:hypothetical protein